LRESHRPLETKRNETTTTRSRGRRRTTDDAERCDEIDGRA
jgi:hypothetical protein